MQRWQCPIYNSALETKIWPKMWKIPSFSCLLSPLIRIKKKCVSHFCREPAYENKQFKKTKKTWIYNSYLIRQSFWGYRCELDIAIFCKGTNEITHTVLLNTAGTVFPIPDVLSVYFWIYNIDTSRYEYFPNQGLCYTIYTLAKR